MRVWEALVPTGFRWQERSAGATGRFPVSFQFAALTPNCIRGYPLNWERVIWNSLSGKYLGRTHGTRRLLPLNEIFAGDFTGGWRLAAQFLAHMNVQRLQGSTLKRETVDSRSLRYSGEL